MALVKPNFLQTQTYSAAALRRSMAHVGPIQQGVWEAGHYKVTQRGAGATQSVDIAPGYATVNWLSYIDQQYLQYNDFTINVLVSASNGTNPRIDQVVLQVNDNTEGVGGNDTPQIVVVAGTPTAGATLDNRSGAAALGNNQLRLADVLVPAASTSVVNANIRDRRSWARGAFYSTTRTANAVGGSDYTTTASTNTLVDSANLAPRIECSGAPLRVSYQGLVGHTAAGGVTVVGLFVDGAAPSGLTSGYNIGYWTAPSAATANEVPFSFVLYPLPGSHVFALTMRQGGSGTSRVYASTDNPLQFTVEELIRANTNNS